MIYFIWFLQKKSNKLFKIKNKKLQKRYKTIFINKTDTNNRSRKVLLGFLFFVKKSFEFQAKYGYVLQILQRIAGHRLQRAVEELRIEMQHVVQLIHN